MRFHFLGLGPIGSLVAHHLRRAVASNHVITLLHNKAKYALEIQRAGGALRVQREGEVFSVSGFKSQLFDPGLQPQHPLLDEPGDRGSDQIESLIVTTGAHRTIHCIRKLVPRLSRHSTIVLLQTGMGIYEQLISQVFRNALHRPHFIIASNSHSAYKTATYDAVHTKLGHIHFAVAPDPEGRAFEAGFNEETPATQARPRLADITMPSDPDFSKYKSLRNTVAALLLTESLNTSWQPYEQVQMTMRRRLVAHSAIYPITALMNCRNGALIDSPICAHIIRSVCEEASAVFAADLRAQIIATDAEAENIHRALTPDSLEEECWRILRETSKDVSPMLQHIRQGKGSEVDFLGGHLLRMGKAFNVRMPVTMTLTQLVQTRSAIPLDQQF
ncbi:ketopantoate reductase-like protein [Mycena floridula]|nr:ketopantoate reductase-like protein [Mycena floridula]